ncbi:MAG: glycosyltransferase family 2 protein [Candidatus Omnitrophica bacterium]|nr:glycosyltransferase family 2 protein [Candidatus Omnitrophota bacterium]
MDAPVCDLVLLSWNHLEETQACLTSLLETTQAPCRLLIVDNGSEAHVRAFLATVKPRGAIQEVALLQNETNEGFPKGMNRGIAASRAPYTCLLNNDLRFTSGWLQEMLEVAQAQPLVGLVNPTSNTFGNHPPPGMSLQAYADSLRALRGRYTEVGMCIGFCMLIKREILERIGGLSEEVERVFFEDEDFSMRAQRAGFQCVVAAASYVYHAEHRSVREMPEREALFTRNQRWCHEKWGRWVRIAWPWFHPVSPGSADLRQWLERLQGWVRRRVHVYVYSPLPNGMTAEALFRSVGLVPHADILWHAVSTRAAPLVAAGLILTRQKKPFDLIAAPEPRWARLMRRLRRVHHAEVVDQADEAGLLTSWQRRAYPHRAGA